MSILKKLTPADFVSFIGLFFSWVSITLVIINKPNLGIVFMMVAFIFDMLDGYVARRLKVESSLGRQVDSFVDIFVYLVFSAVLYFKSISPNWIVGIAVSYTIILFGGLRLLRFNDEGILDDGDTKYYRGITVLHIALLTIILYFTKNLFLLIDGYFSGLLIFIVCPFMLSNYKTYKNFPYWLLFVVVISIIVSALLFEYAI